jgi:hypothetical protein
MAGQFVLPQPNGLLGEGVALGDQHLSGEGHSSTQVSALKNMKADAKMRRAS